MPVHKLRVEYRAYAVHLLLKPLGLLLEMSLYRNRIYVRFIQREKLKKSCNNFTEHKEETGFASLETKVFKEEIFCRELEFFSSLFMGYQVLSKRIGGSSRS
jgi:hypothetical protein